MAVTRRGMSGRSCVGTQSGSQHLNQLSSWRAVCWHARTFFCSQNSTSYSSGSMNTLYSSLRSG